jgi:ABC-type branched-subunit amino acid transport system substrate-binding protein
VAGALAIAGCASSSSNQSVTISGKNLALYISAPTGYRSVPQLLDTVEAEQLAYAQHASEVTAFKLHLHPVLVATKLSDNARIAINNSDAVAYLGELTPGASEQTVGINDAEDLLQVSPTDSALELTQASAAVPGSPKHFYESTSSYGRTFGRIVPSSAVEAQAQVTEMKSLGVSDLYVSDDGSNYGAAIALAVKTDAKTAGITVTSSESAANGVFYGAQICVTTPAAPGCTPVSTAAKAFTAAAAAAPSAKLFAPSALDTPAFASAVGSVNNLYVSAPGYKSTQSLPAAGEQFISSFRTDYGHAPDPQAIFGYQAMLSVLDAIHSAGRAATDRAAVVNDFLATKNPADSVIGPFAMDSKGDSNFNEFVFSKLVAGAFKPIAQVQG